MPVMESTPDFLVYMLSAFTSRARAAVAASKAVVRTIIAINGGTVYGRGKEVEEVEATAARL
jgi:hypothetical protein